MPPRSYDYVVVDVFTGTPFEGNPLAVFSQPAGLADDEMQTFARELNLSETVFVMPSRRPEAVATLRIFTPRQELSFAGHPTIGAAFVLCADGRVPEGAQHFVLDEGIGPVPVRLESRTPFAAWLRTPPIRLGATHNPSACARALGLGDDDLCSGVPPQLAGAGNPFLYVALATPAAVDRAALDAAAIGRELGDAAANGVFVFAPTGQGAYSRMFAPMSGILEDPATGSATGPLVAYMLAHRLCERRQGLRLLNEQGVKMRRRSAIHALLHLSPAGELDYVEVGGSAVQVIRGTVMLG